MVSKAATSSTFDGLSTTARSRPDGTGEDGRSGSRAAWLRGSGL